MWSKRQVARSRTAAMLMVGLISLPMMVWAAGKKPSVEQIQGQERVLHALNRFTFGPRPGDVAAVEQMGLKRWFDLQLNPARIDDSALDQRLAMFPAMTMPQEQMMERYPNPQMLRQIIAKNLPLPSDPVEHAIYADEIAFYQMQKAKKEAEKASGDAKTGAGMENTESSMAMAATAAREVQSAPGLSADALTKLTPDARMRRILAMQPEELVALRKGVGGGQLAVLTEGLSPVQRETLAALQGPERVIGAELVESRMVRDIYSERQLEAVMTDFWLNHFNVYIKKNQHEPYLLPAFEREAIRPHALGKFEDLLVATARSPAMLMYLDNWQSIGPDSQAAQRGGQIARMAQNPQVKQAVKDRGLNENYARELMELHTLGVACEVSKDHPANRLDKACKGGYTQRDVTQVAEVLSGWTVDQPERTGAFRFEERRHEPGDKLVMGEKIHERGEAEGRELLHKLATSPATAKLISTELAVRFVSDTPPQSLIDHMAKVFTKSGGDIRVVLRAMFDSPEFWSPQAYRAKVKTPEEFVISAVRASGAEVTNAGSLVQSLDKLGMPLYGMQTPNGYSWMAEPWVNTGDLLNRMNFALGLSADKVRGVQTEWTTLLTSAGTNEYGAASNSLDGAAEKEKRLEILLLGQLAQEQTTSAVLQQIAQNGQQLGSANGPVHREVAAQNGSVVRAATAKPPVQPPQDRDAATIAGLLLGSPEFQRR